MAEAKVKKEKVTAKKSEVVVEEKKELARPIKYSPAQIAATYEQAKQELARRNDEDWLKYYVKIVNKDGDIVAFTLNPIQKDIEKKIKELEAAGIPARIIILKSRQVGGSTYIQGKFICRIIKNKNRIALVVAHRDDSTNAIFEKAKFMNNNLPANVKPLQQASNARELIFDRPPHYKGKLEGLNSRIKVQTAGSEGIGRSDTHYYVHLSEFAFYSGNPKKSLTGILKSVPKKVGTIVVIESTANGMNDFKDLWDKAEEGKGQWVPMFFAWFDSPEYQMDVNETERNEIIQGMEESKGHNKDCDCLQCYLRNIKELYNLTIEQIAWYIWSLENDCNGDRNLMKQECPTFPTEAFLSTGRPVFNNEKALMRIEQLKKQYKIKPPKRGSFIFEWNNPETKDKIKDSSIRFVNGYGDFITIYEEPIAGHPYVIGGDTKGEGSDYFAGTVIDNSSGKRVATLHGDMGPDTYAHLVYCLGRHYNNALISIEINFDIFPVIELERLHYPKQYRREILDDISTKKQYKNGWKTDGNTRPYIISLEVSLIRDNPELFTHIDMLRECVTFVKDKNGRPDAESGKHDDILMSDMIANASRSQQRFTVERSATFELPPNMSEEEKARVKANIDFSDKYVEMAKYRRKK